MRRTHAALGSMQAAAALSPRRTTSFSVISSEEQSELEWFDAEGMRSPTMMLSGAPPPSDSGV